MKNFILAVGLLIANIGFAHADSFAGANANANAGATSVVNNSPTINSTVGSTSGVNLESGAITNTATTGASSAQNGNMAVRTGDSNITFEAAKIPNIPPRRLRCHRLWVQLLKFLAH